MCGVQTLMARSPYEYTVKFRLFEEWHYDTIPAESAEHAAWLFWEKLKNSADENGMITFQTPGGISQVRLTAITGVVVQK